MNLAQFPRRGYVTTPTPIEYCPNIKRDDMLPGTDGVNKTRKLDFCIADALQKGCDTVITCGAVQSNHCRLTLSWAVHEGMDCHLVLEERVKGSYNPEASGNNFLFQLLGVKSITVVPGDVYKRQALHRPRRRFHASGCPGLCGLHGRNHAPDVRDGPQL